MAFPRAFSGSGRWFLLVSCPLLLLVSTLKAQENDSAANSSAKVFHSAVAASSTNPEGGGAPDSTGAIPGTTTSAAFQRDSMPVPVAPAVESAPAGSVKVVEASSIVPRQKQKLVINLAVSDLLGKGVTQPEADLITEQVRASMLATGTFKVMERSMMDQIMAEQGFQQSGSCDNSDCLVEVGRVLGVQTLVVGSVGRVGRIFMINVKLVDVATGEVKKSLTETCECSIEELLRTTPPKVAASLDYEYRKSHAGTLQVLSQPVGANVFLDDVKMGTTPWNSDLLDPGPYKVSVVLPDWKRIDRIIELQSMKEFPLNLTLERSDEWIAAQRAAEELAKMAELARQEETKRLQESARAQKKLFWRIGLSAISAVCVGGGYYFQTLADENQAAADRSYEKYKATDNSVVMEIAKADIDYNETQTKKNRNLRNISYGLGVAALSSISFTFLF
ncbi:MAG: PEGA domain-containing protein [Fibrobacteria bacterium]|nr:PEGA domain-containing protein [Fibrobacteria bacterium]